MALQLLKKSVLYARCFTYQIDRTNYPKEVSFGLVVCKTIQLCVKSFGISTIFVNNFQNIMMFNILDGSLPLYFNLCSLVGTYCLLICLGRRKVSKNQHVTSLCSIKLYQIQWYQILSVAATLHTEATRSTTAPREGTEAILSSGLSFRLQNSQSPALSSWRLWLPN